MRIGLIAALRAGADGGLRAALPLAGRSVLGWQAMLLRSLGVERVLCLTDTPGAEIIALQHELEAQGVQFHALKGFAAIPALVRAEDDLVILCDGLVPDPAVVHAVLGGESGLTRAVGTIPGDHPLAATHPEDFERIDAGRHWAGVLAMRGAPVQHLADFPADSDAIAVLLRLALQAGTPTQDLAARELVPESWLLAKSPDALTRHETALITRAAPPADWRAPSLALASAAVRQAVARGVGEGGPVAGAAGLGLLLVGVTAAAFGFPAAGLAAAGIGAFGTELAATFGAVTARLRREEPSARARALLRVATDVVAGVVVWSALVPWPEWQPLAALGPLVIGLARVVSRSGDSALAAAARDRASLLFLLALSAAFGLLPEVLACLALGLLAALLLRDGKE
jgi:hypothetical protein